MKKTLPAIPRLAVLFTLSLVIGSFSLASASGQDIGSFEDILIALEPETRALEGPTLSGPQAVDLIPSTPFESDGLILEGPLTTPRSMHYPPENQTTPGSVMAPGQVQNPFHDFEPAIEATAPKQVAETQYDFPPADVAPSVVAPRETLPRIAAPVPNVVTQPRSNDLLHGREFVIPQKPTVPVQPRVVTKTIVVETVKPQCPYERARQLQRSNPYKGYKTGYIPYGGRGLDRDYRNYRDYDRYRSDVYRSRSTRYVPVPYSQGYRYSQRSSGYSGYGGRGFSIGFGF